MYAMRASIGAVAPVLLLGLLSLATACGGCSEDSGPPAGAPGGAPTAGETAGTDKPAAELKKVDPATVGSASGLVRVEGDVPPPRKFAPSGDTKCIEAHAELTDDALLASGGKLQNAFVWISDGLQGYAFETPKTPVDVQQTGCVYSPRMVGLMVNQTLLVHNNDPTMHNVDAKAKVNKPSNVAQPQGTPPREFSFRKPEVAIPLVCDVHAWMRSNVAVVPHPCFAITGADGAFTIKGLPPGKYTVQAWHETLGTQQAEVTVETGKDSRVADLVFHK
jgi:hypothetical protein